VEGRGFAASRRTARRGGTGVVSRGSVAVAAASRLLDRSFMKIADVPFHTTDWAQVPTTEHRGTTGVATWRTIEVGNLRVRMVEYSAGYRADHWCERGHVLLVLDGELETELGDGSRVVLRAGTSYQVADGASRHRSATASGARLFIVD
jgi:quercetin dioxygenase-like cupin family protein